MFTNPEQNIAQLGLTEGMRVADFGAGSGFYCKAASQKVGNTGKVYAIEVQKDLVKRLESEMRHYGISNVECIWGDIEKVGGTKLSDRSLDAVIISNVLFQAEDKLGLIDEAKRIIKPNGKVLFIDWKEASPLGGPSLKDVILPKRAQDLFVQRGFVFVEDVRTSDHHYGIIFRRETH